MAASVVSGPQPLLPHALRLHILGASVIPVRFGTKKPAVRWKQFQKQRACEQTLRDWFADIDSGNRGIGVVLGQISGGLLVRDFDNSDGYHTLVRNHPRIVQSLPTARTHRGYHVWFRCCDYLEDGAKTFCWRYADGELRGDGQIVVVPPTIHASSGLPYSWEIEPASAIPLVELSALGIQPPERYVTQEVCVLLSGAIADVVPTMIEQTLPTGPGQRHRCLFEFARRLKGHPALADRSLSELEPYVRQWFERAKPRVRTKVYEETFSDFKRTWGHVKWPAGVGSLRAALARATARPIPDEAKRFKSPRKRLLVALCRELQKERGDRPFFLACRDVSQAVGMGGRQPHILAWRWLKEFCDSGILAPGQSGSLATRKANEYRYLVPM